MLIMLLKMASVTALIVMLSVMIWIWVNHEKLTIFGKVLIGLIYGTCAILSTHLGIDYVNMLLNVRDLGPLIAGIFFDPISGLIAGFLGGIERYIVGEYFGIGEYTRVACGISTCLAGIIGACVRYVINGRKIPVAYCFFVGAVMEVFHMYAIFITHRDDMMMAFKVVDACSLPMISFTAVGMALTAIIIYTYEYGFTDFFKHKKDEDIPIARKFQSRLFFILVVLITINFLGVYFLQTESARQNAIYTLNQSEENIMIHYNSTGKVSDRIKVGTDGFFCIYSEETGMIKQGAHAGETFSSVEMKFLKAQANRDMFTREYFGVESLCKVKRIDKVTLLLVAAPIHEIYWFRDIEIYETAFSAILLFAVVYVLISLIVNLIVVSKLNRINETLVKITNGELDEVVDVKDSYEFKRLSDSINKTVDALKGYIEEAKHRIEEELEFARNIQMSALPTQFTFKGRDEFNLYAMMDAAKEVGGDFYDFFFVSINKLALVVADVSGKGIPGALFMMRAKTAIRSYAATNTSLSDILFKVNNVLCEGNDADMFVTAWVGILDLSTGSIECANFGHEFPIVMRADGDYEIVKDVHTLPLATFENTKAKVYEIKLSIGDRIFLYTDGVPEATNKQNEQYGMDRLISVLNRNKACTTEELLKIVRKDVAQFAEGTEQFDDITLLECEFTKYCKITIKSE